MKILLSAYACEPNKGSEPGVGWNWAINLAKSHQVWVLTRQNNREMIDEYIQRLPTGHKENLHFIYYDLPSYILCFKKGQLAIHLYYILWQKMIFNVVKRINENIHFDIIHHLTFNEFRTPGYLYEIGVPFIWGPIGGGQYYKPLYRKAFHSYTDIVKENVRNLINNIALKSSSFNKAIEKSKFVLVADQSTEGILPKKHAHKYKRMLETANYFNNDINKKYNVLQENKLHLLWAGNIIPRKGLILLIEALKKLDINNYSLTVVGDGKEKDFIKGKVCEYNLQDKVSFVGKVPHLEMQNYYLNSDVFVFTSLRDTSGNVVLEAMSKGLPIIALDHHGVADIVSERCGIKIKVTDYDDIIESIRKAILDFYYNKEKLIIMANYAKERIKDVYNWNVKMNQINEIYKQVVS